MQPLTTGGTVGDRTLQGEKSVKIRMRQLLKLKPNLSLILFFFSPTGLTLPASLATTAHSLGAIVTLEKVPLVKISPRVNNHSGVNVFMVAQGGGVLFETELK